jgi:hypothetical protein
VGEKAVKFQDHREGENRRNTYLLNKTKMRQAQIVEKMKEENAQAMSKPQPCKVRIN